MHVHDNSSGEIMQTELNMIESLKRDTIWLRAHIDELRDSHKGHYVAVKDEKVIGSDKDLKNLISSLKQKGINPSLVLVEFVSAKPIKLIFGRR